MSANALLPVAGSRFSQDVRDGLTKAPQKELPSTYLYDDMGSALFDAITLLPEYELTRADARLLEKHSAEIVGMLFGPLLVAELGSGSGEKTRWILEAAAAKHPVPYLPIDISAAALKKCAQTLSEVPNTRIVPLEMSYLDGLAEAVSRRTRSQRVLLLFLGSTIGNFDAAAARDFLREIRRILRTGDALLLGTDLLKPVPRMLLAYDDPIGLTAAFNLNLLARMNRELGANFDIRSFKHEARFNAQESRMEMHLCSTRAQTVVIDSADLSVRFGAGETIWTEASYKFRPEQVRALAESSGFDCAGQWIDKASPFAESLLMAV